MNYRPAVVHGGDWWVRSVIGYDLLHSVVDERQAQQGWLARLVSCAGLSFTHFLEYMSCWLACVYQISMVRNC